MDSPCTSPLFHTDVRLVSPGKMLTRLAELKIEVEIFLRETKSNLGKVFGSAYWMAKLSYLSDIYNPK
jgi:hypothetical protein